MQVGVLAPLSGVYASLGANKVNGIKMFFNEQQMTVEGTKIELVIEDDEAKPQEGLRKARKLVEQDNVDVLLGVISSAIGYALKEYVNRAKKVWVTTGAAADGIFKKSNINPYAFRSSLSVYQANEPMGTWLGDKGLKKVFVTGPDYAMGREAIVAFEKTFKVKGGERVGEVFAPLGTNDFAPFLTEIKRANPEVVYASYAGSDAVRFVQQFSAFGLQNSIKLAGYEVTKAWKVHDRGARASSHRRLYFGLNWAYGNRLSPDEQGVRRQLSQAVRQHSDGRLGCGLRWRAGGLERAQETGRENSEPGGAEQGSAGDEDRYATRPDQLRSGNQQRHPEYLHPRNG